MKLNTRLIITFTLFFIVPTLLVIGSYAVLRYIFGFFIFEETIVNGETCIIMTKDSLLTLIIVVTCVIILTGIVLTNWLMYGFIKPINELKKAILSIQALIYLKKRFITLRSAITTQVLLSRNRPNSKDFSRISNP